MIKKYDEHLTFDLPYGYEANTGINDDGSRSFSVNCGTGINSDGEPTAEVKILLRHLEGAIDPEKSNFSGDFPALTAGTISEMGFGFSIQSSYSSSPGRTITIQILIFMVGISCENDSYALIAVKTSRESSFSESCELIAKHMNRLLGCIKLDGKKGNFQKLTGWNVQRTLKVGKSSGEDSVEQSVNRLLNTSATTNKKTTKNKMINDSISISEPSKPVDPVEEARRKEEEARKAEEAKKKAAEEAERRRREKEEEDKYRAWQRERQTILDRRDSLARQEIDARNNQLKSDLDQITNEYESRFGESIRKREALVKELEEIRNSISTINNTPKKGGNILLAWGIGQPLLGLAVVAFAPIIGVLNIILGGLILAVAISAKTKSNKTLSDLKAKEAKAVQELASIPVCPTLTQFSEENKGRFNIEALNSGGHISDWEEKEIRSRIERQNPIPPEPPRPASMNRSSYSSGNLTARQSRDEVLKQAIVDALSCGESMTISDMLENIPELEGESNQHTSALCRSLVLSGRIEKYTEQRRTYFRVS